MKFEYTYTYFLLCRHHKYLCLLNGDVRNKKKIPNDLSKYVRSGSQMS